MAVDPFLDDLYREVVMDHFRSPRHRAVIEAPNVSAEGYNPLCGDEVAVQLKLDGADVVKIGVQVRGCSICQASGSMMAEEVLGKNLSQTLELIGSFVEMMSGKDRQEAPAELGEDIEALFGVRKFPARVKCALLPWTTLQEGIEQKESGSRAGEGEGA